MAIYRPRSILQLILTAFVVVTVPLIVAVVTAAVYVDRLTKQGQRSVFEAVAATQSSRMLVEHITAMERSARQFQVLNDRALLDVYMTRRDQFLQAMKDLRALDLNRSQRETVDMLAEREADVYEALRARPPTDIDTAVEAFPALNAAARGILARSSELISEGVNDMHSMSARAQQLLFWQASALVPTALLFAALFIALITRPLRRLDQSIRQLGDGRFNEEIEVHGPSDIQELGRRLEWMRQRILELENQKVAFLRHVSHELKTPLTTIREGSDLLTEQVVGRLNTEQGEIARMLKQNSLKLQRLIEDLLNFNMLQIDAQPARIKELRLDLLIEDVVDGHRLAAKSRSVQLETRLEVVTMAGDAGKLRTAVDNLLSNAVKYSPAGGRVRITLLRTGEHIAVDVEDEGPGVERNERTHIFEAFYQGRARAEGPVKGSGLGLSIAREFAGLHNGTIELLDGEHGAHFRLLLPADRTATHADVA